MSEAEAVELKPKIDRGARAKTSISSISSSLVRMPLANAASFATRSVTHRDYVLVKIVDTAGREGIGLTYAGSTAGSIVQEAISIFLAPLLIGADVFAIEAHWEKMYREAMLHGRAGSVMRALSAIDIALWDLNARSAGLPLWQYLGSHSTGSVRCYASGGYYGSKKTTRDLAAEMRSYADKGFKAVKMKVGLLDPAEEEDRVKAVREAIGPDVELFLDANNAWPDLRTALRYVRRLEQYSPGWIEEPFSPDDIESHARLSLATTIPVATGEIEAGRWRFKALLDQRAAHILQTDGLVCGGFTEWRRIASLASAYGVPVSPHAWHNVHVHFTASVPNSPFVEYFVDDSIISLQPLLDRRLDPVKGMIELPDTPGLGFDFNEATVERYGITKWQKSAK
jgi:L-alanine-DL-glutamate epimerase-like enolase superfamily enzyme